MNKKEKEFVEYVKSECKKYGVKCDLRKTGYLILSGNIKCSGYFDPAVPTLVCATKQDKWIEILAHEFGHFTQWVDQTTLWKKAISSMPYVDDWLSGEKVRNIKRHIGICRDMELENEKRTVNIIKDFGLNVNIEGYIKRANAYIFFYNRLLATRKWSTPNNSPYKNKNIIQMMPPRFIRDYSTTPKKIEKVFIQENL